jgi:transcriptional regulator with XRE-family HTH domain
MMASAGESLRDLREVAGMTVIEVSDALNLRDKGILEAVEDGREVLSFELILRLASLVARNDPLPFVLKYTRTYHPRLWQVLHELKIDQFRSSSNRSAISSTSTAGDTARKLSDVGFERVLQF